MVENGYLGVACEPNCVFQICNQPAILGFRLHDLLTGGSIAEVVRTATRGPGAVRAPRRQGALQQDAGQDTRGVRDNAGPGSTPGAAR